MPLMVMVHGGLLCPEGRFCALVATLWNDPATRQRMDSTICDLMLAGF